MADDDRNFPASCSAARRDSTSRRSSTSSPHALSRNDARASSGRSNASAKTSLILCQRSMRYADDSTTVIRRFQTGEEEPSAVFSQDTDDVLPKLLEARLHQEANPQELRNEERWNHVEER